MAQRILILLVALAFLPIAGPLSAQPIEILPTTVDGTVPGTTITYTITATGMAREIWAPGSTDNDIWEWNNGFPEFVSVGTQTLTVDFSDPLPLNRVILGVNSFGTGPFTLTLNGGSAGTADFDLTDGIAAVGGSGPANYNGATGEFTATAGDQTLMIGSTSSNTLTQFTLTGDNGGDGYTLFFGVTTVAPTPPPTAIEVPALNGVGIGLLVLLLIGGAVLVIKKR